MRRRIVTARLKRLFRPQSVVVIGGGFWGRNVIRSLKAMGFAGAIWPVHPKAAEVEGEHAFAALDALPGVPDACFIGVNRHATIPILKDLSDMGAGGTVCFASGFAEAGETELTDALLNAAGDMAVIGPNCYGFVNALDRTALWPDVHGLIPVDTGVAILTQSSNIALNLSSQQRGLPIGFLGTAGNQAQIGLAAIGRHLIRDPRITALGLHIEGVGDVHALQSLAQDAAELGKSIIVLKPGKSEAAQDAAISHTASLAGSDAGAGALLSRLGMIRVDSLDAFLEALKYAHLFGRAPVGALAALSCSGGEASLMADGCEERGLPLAPITEQQDRNLAELLGPIVTRANPLDYHTFIWGDAPTMGQVYAAMMDGPADVTVIVVDFPRADRCDPGAWDCVVEAARYANSLGRGRLVLMCSIADAMTEAIADQLLADDILPFMGLQAGLDALAAIHHSGRDAAPERAIPLPRSDAQPEMQDEASAKSELRASGLDIPKGFLADGVEAAVSAAKGHFPVVLKAREVAHKSDAGGVALNLSSSEAVRSAATDMASDQFYVEEMIDNGVVELLVAILADPAHGYVLTVGAGGVLTELWQDTQCLLVPATGDEIEAALARLRIGPLLDGYRGKPSVSKAAVVDAVLRLQSYVMSSDGCVAEIEINPMILTPDRAVVADALIREEIT